MEHLEVRAVVTSRCTGRRCVRWRRRPPDASGPCRRSARCPWCRTRACVRTWTSWTVCWWTCTTRSSRRRWSRRRRRICTTSRRRRAWAARCAPTSSSSRTTTPTARPTRCAGSCTPRRPNQNAPPPSPGGCPDTSEHHRPPDRYNTNTKKVVFLKTSIMCFKFFFLYGSGASPRTSF